MSTDECKTVAVLGGSYGGYRAAQVLAAGLPSGWRVVLVDRNSHFNHVYNFPRYTVLPGHEHKAFIPYNNLLHNSLDSNPTSSDPHERVHGTIISLHLHHIIYKPHVDSDPVSLDPSSVEETEEKTLHFDYAIYALGSHHPSPIELFESRDINISPLEAQGLLHSDIEKDLRRVNRVHLYVGTKQQGISRLRSRQRTIEAARQVLVVGGGALGIQFASDIAAIYPRKSVTLLHSRSKLLPRFDEALGDEAYQGLQELGVQVIFGERLDMSLIGNTSNIFTNQETMLLKTIKGREIEADLVLLCTGQKPNTSLVHSMDSCTINPDNGMVRVLPTLQILGIREKDATLSEDNPNGFIHSTADSSPTLCGTTPPSPVDTLIELDSALSAWTLPGSCIHEMTTESEAKAIQSPNTFVYPHIFAIGDAADAFGALKAGHTAYYQGEVAARNVIRLVQGETKTEGDGSGAGDLGESELEEYVPGLPMIKVTLGLTKSAYEVAGVVGTKDDGTDDLGAAAIWKAYGYSDVDDEGMLA